MIRRNFALASTGDEIVDGADHTRVFADSLQATGDPRGELIALELASIQAPTTADARALNHQAQQLREDADGLVWPKDLHHAWLEGIGLPYLRAGFLVELRWRLGYFVAPGALCARPEAARLRETRGVWPSNLVPEQRPVTLRLDHLDEGVNLGRFGPFTSLRTLEVVGSSLHPRHVPDFIAQLRALDQLQELRVSEYANPILPSLGRLPIEHFAGSTARRRELDALGEFPNLRGLELDRLVFGKSGGEKASRLAALPSLARLERLEVRAGGSPVSWAQLVPRLDLSQLSLLRDEDMDDVRGWTRVHAALASHTRLEHLGMYAKYATPKLFAKLPALRSLELWDRGERLGWSRPPFELPPLERLQVTGSVLGRLSARTSPTLVIRDAHHLPGPKLWRVLAGLDGPGELRRLALDRHDELGELAVSVLATVEELELGRVPTGKQVEQLARLKRLRRLRLTAPMRVAVHRELCRALPAVLVETTHWWP